MTAQAASVPRKRTVAYRLNLVMVGLVTFYSVFIAWQVMQHMMCGEIGVDFCQYWSVGKVARIHGYAHAYDPQFLGPVENTIVPGATAASQAPILPPVPYLAVFVLPFQLFSLLSPAVGYWVWTCVNAIALLLYVRFFTRRLNIDPLSSRVMFMLFASLPAFTNLLLGQMEVWLVICIGEFMRAMFDRKPFRAGLWLGGLLLKPPVLIFIGLILLVQRSIRILAGLAASCSLLLIISFLLTGPVGFVDMLKLWLLWANGNVNIFVEAMMNWRMLGTQLSNLVGGWIGWGAAGAGMLTTLAVMLYVWRNPFDPDSPSFPVAVAGILAGSAMLSWHSHIHMAMMLLPPILYLYQKQLLPERLLNYWIFVPASLYVAMVFIPESLIALQLVSPATTPLIFFVIGGSQFSANLYLFIWAARTSTQQSRALPNVAVGDLPSQ